MEFLSQWFQLSVAWFKSLFFLALLKTDSIRRDQEEGLVEDWRGFLSPANEKPVSAEPIYQLTKESVLEGRIELAMDAFLPNCLHKNYQSYFLVTRDWVLLCKTKTVTYCPEIHSFEIFVNSISKETHVQRKAGHLCACKGITGQEMSASLQKWGGMSGFKNDFKAAEKTPP